MSTLFQVPVVALILAGVVASFLCGWRGVSVSAGVLAGWMTFLGACLFNDLVLPELALHCLPREEAWRIIPETPGSPGMFLFGWVPALLLYAVGRLTRRGLRFFRKKRVPGEAV